MTYVLGFLMGSGFTLLWLDAFFLVRWSPWWRRQP